VAQSNLKILAAAAFLALVAVSCASRPPEAGTYPLLEKTVETSNGAVIGRIPQGWSTAVSESLPSGVEAWLVSDDGGAFMALREINLDRPTSQRVREEGLELLARLSIAFRSDSARPTGAVSVRSTTLHSFNACSYELRAGAEWKSVFVMTIRGRYYECEANVAQASPERTSRVGEAQKAFCASLTSTSTRE
jgi:hypothetical protein